MDYIEMVERVREELLQEVNRRCDKLIRSYQEGKQGIPSRTETWERTLAWISPATLKGKKGDIEFTSLQTPAPVV